MNQNMETEVAVCDAISRNQKAIHIGLVFASSVNQRSASFHSGQWQWAKRPRVFHNFFIQLSHNPFKGNTSNTHNCVNIKLTSLFPGFHTRPSTAIVH